MQLVAFKALVLATSTKVIGQGLSKLSRMGNFSHSWINFSLCATKIDACRCCILRYFHTPTEIVQSTFPINFSACKPENELISVPPEMEPPGVIRDVSNMNVSELAQVQGVKCASVQASKIGLHL